MIESKSVNQDIIEEDGKERQKAFLTTWHYQGYNTEPFLKELLKVDSITERDQMVAETVVQWMGSLVGDYYLRAVLANQKQILDQKNKDKDEA